MSVNGLSSLLKSGYVTGRVPKCDTYYIQRVSLEDAKLGAARRNWSVSLQKKLRECLQFFLLCSSVTRSKTKNKIRHFSDINAQKYSVRAFTSAGEKFLLFAYFNINLSPPFRDKRRKLSNKMIITSFYTQIHCVLNFQYNSNNLLDAGS